MVAELNKAIKNGTIAAILVRLDQLNRNAIDQLREAIEDFESSRRR